MPKSVKVGRLAKSGKSGDLNPNFSRKPPSRGLGGGVPFYHFSETYNFFILSLI